MCYLDALKGILIILVILGHVIQGAVQDYQHNDLFRFIYSFHMPLFFLISGYLTYKGYFDRKLVYKRFLQCIIPFLTWAFILPLLENGTFDSSRTVKILFYPDNGLWFLWNLFFYSLIFNLSEHLSNNNRKQELVILAFFALCFVMMALFNTKFNCTQICWYLPFFTMGYYMRKYPKLVDRKIAIVLIIGYILTIPFWMMREEPLFYKWLNLGNTFSYVYRLFVQIAGAYSLFYIGKQILNRQIPFINYLGTRTLGIYAFQFIVLYHFTIKGNVVYTTVICTMLSLLCVKIVHGIKYIRLLLIGEK